MTEQETKLLPCPFCGSNEVNDTTLPQKQLDNPDNPHEALFLVCPNCVACGPIGETTEEIVSLWNTRVKTNEQDEIND